MGICHTLSYFCFFWFVTMSLAFYDIPTVICCHLWCAVSDRFQLDCYAVVTCEIKLFWNNFEIISLFYYFTRNMLVTSEIKHWDNFKIISVFHLTCNHVWNRNKIISAAEQILKLHQNYFWRQWTCWKMFVSCNKPVK